MATKVKQSPAAVEMSAAALKFLESLTLEQRGKVTFDYGDAERLFWCHAPVNQRGISLKQMSDKQHEAALSLISSGLTEKASNHAQAIIEQEGKDWKQSAKKPGGEMWPLPPGWTVEHDSGFYFWTIFGQPGGAEPWGWRAQGHHLSLNFSVFRGQIIATTPFYFGARPFSLLAPSQDLAFDLISSLEGQQRANAIINPQAPWDLLTWNGSRAVFMPNEGLPASQMNANQRGILVALITEYVGRVRSDVSQPTLDELEQGLDRLYFSWAGAVQKDKCHYYRVAGAYFLLEWITPYNQDNSNHMHSVLRDVANDFALCGPDRLIYKMLQSRPVSVAT